MDKKSKVSTSSSSNPPLISSRSAKSVSTSQVTRSSASKTTSKPTSQLSTSPSSSSLSSSASKTTTKSTPSTNASSSSTSSSSSSSKPSLTPYTREKSGSISTLIKANSSASMSKSSSIASMNKSGSFRQMVMAHKQEFMKNPNSKSNEIEVSFGGGEISNVIYQQAQFSGILNLSNRNLETVPDEVCKFYELTFESKDPQKQGEWWGRQDLKKLDLSYNSLKDLPTGILLFFALFKILQIFFYS